MIAESGSFTLTGTQVSFNPLNCESGIYAIVGSVADRLYISAGAYSGSGWSVNLDIGFNAVPGNYEIGWSDVPWLNAQPGIFSSTGTASNLIVSFSTIPAGKLVYLFTMRGSTDIEIPIKSFQARKKSGFPTFLQIVIPGLDYIYEINSRATNGQLIIDVGYEINEEILHRTTIIEADLEDVFEYDGAESKSITLLGYSTQTHNNHTIKMSSPSYRSTINGFMRYRFPNPNVYVKPGDTVIVGDDTLKVDVISYFIGAKTSVMELSEELYG